MNFDEAKELIEYKTGVWIKLDDDIPKDREKVLARTEDRLIYLLNYSTDLYKVDEYDFCNEKSKSGFYDYDSEFGYYTMSGIVEFMHIPE